MLHVRDITKTYGDKEVLRDVSFVVNAGERLALLGPNGSGKSTLLRLLAGVEPPETGEVALSPPTAQIAYLPQGYADRPDLTVAEAVPGLARRRSQERRVAYLAGRLSEPGTGGLSLSEAYDAALDELHAATDAIGDLDALLEQWGLGDLDADRPVDSLSGGEQTRLGLAALLAERPDVLLLDEPTNHLDLEGIERLEGWLSSFNGALVLVTHDRALLATTPTSLLELEGESGDWREFSGAYPAFIEAKERELAEQRAAFGRQERRTRRVQEKIRRLEQWARRIEGETKHFHYS